MDVDYIQNGYFIYQQRSYFICRVDSSFMMIYSYYDYMIHMLNIHGYRIIKNCFQQTMSQNYILFEYQDEQIDMNNYIRYSLQIIPISTLRICDIKESWIQKVDDVRDEISKYSYSFEYDKDLNALLHYYCGLCENGICLLNEILFLNKNAVVPMTLTLNYAVQYYYQLLNPCHYTLSSRAKQIYILLTSEVMSFSSLKQFIEESYFDVFELLYLYARMFYPSVFFEAVLKEEMDYQKIKYFLNQYKIELNCIKQMYDIISQYVTLPKMSWIE